VKPRKSYISGLPVGVVMARRRTRSKTTRRRSPKTFNLGGLAESALIANAVTQGFFDVSLQDFLFTTTGGTRGQITGRELLSGITGGSFGTQYTERRAKVGGGSTYSSVGQPFAAQVRENLSNNGAAMVGQLILIPAGFKVFSKLTTKPRGTLNRALKMSGLPLKV